MPGHSRPGALRASSRHSFSFSNLHVLFQTNQASSFFHTRASARRNLTPSVLALAAVQRTGLARLGLRGRLGEAALPRSGRTTATGIPRRCRRQARTPMSTPSGPGRARGWTNAVANTLLAGTAAGSTGAVVHHYRRPARRSSSAQLGAAENATGTVTVGGPNATWTNGNALSVGRQPGHRHAGHQAWAVGAPSGSTIVGRGCGTPSVR